MNANRLSVWCGVFLLVISLKATAFAQFGGGQGGGMGGGQGGGQQGGQQGGGQQGAGGILVDAQGVVKPVFLRDPHARLDARRRGELASRDLAQELVRSSPIRKVSLVKLEAACADFAREKKPVPAEMQFLAGLQRIDYVFADPDGHDLVIAGPAEGFLVDPTGRALGAVSKRPTLRLDDLLVALRSQQQGTGQIRCSIDPTPESLARLQKFLAATAVALPPDQAKAKFAKLGEILGLQTISVSGVPAESHFARMLVEADIRMKRLSIDVEPPPVKGFRSHLDLVQKNENSLQRWWFTPLYDPFVRSDDGLAYQLAGQRVQLMSQEELVSPSGQRVDAPFTHVSAQKFAQQFTNRYEEIAAAAPIFAELQNAIDLAILAALFRKENLPTRVGWTPGLFLDEEAAPTDREPVPRQIASISNYKQVNRGLFIAQVGGGVVIHPDQVMRTMEYRRDEQDAVSDRRKSSFPPADRQAGSSAWWWD